MSILFIEEQIRKFLSDDKPEVMAIKGQWGVGKTYSWNAFLGKASKDKIIALPSYTYVSLFGINNLEILKYSLFENSIPVNMIGSEPTLETLKDNTISVIQNYGKIAGGVLKNLPIAKNVTPVIESLAFMNLNKTIICIDDLERKGAGLSLKDVLGLVSLLKEHKKCKVILLLNDGTQETHEFNTYKEKVLDVELSFKPSPEESSIIAYASGKKYYPQLSMFTQKLEIRNIRILKKIERSVDLIEPYFAGTDDALLRSAISSIVLFSWCFYSFNDDDKTPNLNFISNDEFYLYGFVNKKEDNDPKKLAWKKIISEYGYISTDAIDEELLNLVRHGYIQAEAFGKAIEEKNQSVLNGFSRDAFSDAWQKFHDSFENNEKEVLDGLISSFKENYKAITPGNLDALVEFLKQFNRGGDAKDLISTYIEGRKDERELFNVSSRELIRNLTDGDVIDSFNAFYYSTSNDDNETLSELLLRLHKQNSWGDKDVENICQAGVEDFYNAFKSSNGSGAYDVVVAALRFSGLMGGQDDPEEITRKVKWALTIISYESRINQMRVERFKVDLNNL